MVRKVGVCSTIQRTYHGVDGNFQCLLGILFGGDSGLERKVVVQTTDLHVGHEITRQEPDKTR